MEKITVIGVPGAGKTRWIVENVRDRFMTVAITSVTLAPIFENLKRLGLGHKVNGIRTIYGLTYLALEREGLLSRDQKKYLTDYGNLHLKQKLAKKYGLVYLQNRDFVEIDQPSFNTVEVIYSRAIFEYGDYDAWHYFEDLIEVENIPRAIFSEIKTRRNKEEYYDYSFLIEDAFKKELDVLIIPKGKSSAIELSEVWVDEAHDLGKIPYKILENSADRIEKFVMVGDPAQSIYQFLGAKPEILLNHSSKKIFLDKTFRFGEPLTSLANKILKKLKLSYKIKSAEHQTKVLMGAFSKNMLIELLKKLKGEIAILTRTNRQAFRIKKLLRMNGIYAKGIKERDSRLLKAWELFELFRKEKYKELALAFAETELTRGNIQYYMKLAELEANFRQMSKIDFFNFLVAKLNINPDDLLLYLKTRLHGKKMVIVDTIHASKGMEFENVILIDEIPNKIIKLSNSGLYDITEELRVIYVGLTRAKKQLIVLKTRKSYFDYFEI